MKKFFALLCVVAALSPLTGCKKSEPASSTPAASEEKAADEGAMPAKDMPADEAN